MIFQKPDFLFWKPTENCFSLLPTDIVFIPILADKNDQFKKTTTNHLTTHIRQLNNTIQVSFILSYGTKNSTTTKKPLLLYTVLLPVSFRVARTAILTRCFSHHLTDDVPDLRSGPFAQISICDRGTGIPKTILERIFEPHFTTKDVGKGSILDLAVDQRQL
ncbi:hypothetical protein [Desulfosediminicola flagellatus]|uniref:hypothetical protein n=1 Tax=Desulfosediminicola flagellatus TaxID=2569541 RepID=UPI0010AD8572|nr:hypothetical protein [Desulfosediminicola flagellatus]